LMFNKINVYKITHHIQKYIALLTIEESICYQLIHLETVPLWNSS